jgi:hypothetical protein
MALVLAAPTPYFIGLVESQQKLLEQVPGIEGLVVVRLEYVESGANNIVAASPTSAASSSNFNAVITVTSSEAAAARTVSPSAPPLQTSVSSSDIVYMEPRLECADIYYHEEAPQMLPRTGRTESRIRWQLELLRRSPQMRRTSLSFEMDAAEQYRSRSSGIGNVEGTSTSSPHDIICQVFCSYYATWLGPYVADFLLKRRVELQRDLVNCKKIVLPPPPVSPTPVKAPEASFFEALLQSQAYYEAMSRLSDVLDPPSPLPQPSAPLPTTTITAAKYRAQSSEPARHAWFLNPFLVSLVQQNPTIFVAHHEELSHPVSVLTPSPKREQQNTKSWQQGKTAALHRAQKVAKKFNDNIRVRSLLLRSITCCGNDDPDEDELNDLTPVSGSSL